MTDEITRAIGSGAIGGFPESCPNHRFVVFDNTWERCQNCTLERRRAVSAVFTMDDVHAIKRAFKATGDEALVDVARRILAYMENAP